jgi:hypothetical protein
MDRIKTTSLQAENADFAVAAVTDYIAERLGVSAEFIVDLPWQERESLLDTGRIQGRCAWYWTYLHLQFPFQPNPLELEGEPFNIGAQVSHMTRIVAESPCSQDW